MFNNSSHVDASHSTFSEVHRDQHFTSRAHVQGNQTVNTVVYGNQILQSGHIGLEALQKASAPSAAFDSAERHPAPRCLEGTRIQLLDRLTRWIDGEGESDDAKLICWVNGRPGSGKSAVSQTIAEQLASQKRLAASFFFSRRDIERRTTRHFFPTIATQLLSSISTIRPVIFDALEDDPMIPSKVLREQMQKLLLEPLSSGLEHSGAPFLIIVDALDECDDLRLVVELVSLLIQLVRSSSLPLRLLITSRPEPWLQAHFRQPEVVSLTVTLDIQSFSVEDDIRSFLQHALDQVYQEHSQVMPPGPWPSPEDLDRIVKKASGLFIFALTVVKFVGDALHNPIQRLQAILEDKPSRRDDNAYSDLDALYIDAVSTFPDADIVRLILGTVYCLSVPMTVSALHQLLDRPDIDARLVIPALGSVLLSSEDGKQPIQFYHASFRDFLISHQRSRKYTIDPIVYHRLMAQLCFKTMVRSLRRNMCGIESSFRLNRDIEDLQVRRQAAYEEALVYACRYWSHHLTQLPSQGGVYEPLLNAMQEFCSKVLLYWIETASIFDDVENAIIMLRNALNWLKSLVHVPKETATLIEDAERLVLLYRQPISQSALHVYHTAITFIPSSSALYANFKHEAGNTCTILHGQDDEWLAYQYAIDLISVTSVSFSPNGTVVATTGINQGVQLWNVVTGGNVASFGDKSSSVLVRFSTSGTFVAAAFTNGMVAVWDPTLGREHLKDTGVHTETITCLGFSPDSTLLASGARDHTIQLWSLESSQRLHKLVAHEGPVTVFAFTPDSQCLCSGSEDNLLIAWDVKAGKVARGMMGHRAGITALDVSRDGTMVLTGSQDKSVKVWDIQSGSCTRTLSKGHKKVIRSVHFFDDDKRFLSASDGTILSSSVSTRKSSDVTIWDLGQDLRSAMGNAPIWQAKVLGRGLPAFLLRMMVEMNWDGLKSEELLVAYSSQSSSFAFSYLSETWCAPFGSKVDTPNIHASQSYLSALALSPDGTRIAAGSYIGSLDILDTTVPTRNWDEEMKHDHAVPLRSASCVVASPNGARFLVNSGLTWYLTDGEFNLLSKVDFGIADYARTDDVPRPVFSADSNTFAWSMTDIWDRRDKNTVRVYESATGIQTVRFSGLKKVQAFFLSPDGSFITCGHDGAITVCDVGKHIKRAMDVAADTSITALSFSSDSQTLLSGSKEGVVQLWDPLSGACKATITHEEFTSPSTAIGFAPLGDMIVIAHKDGTVRLVSLSTAASHTLCPSGTAFTGNVRDVIFSQDPLKLICRTGDNDVSFWNVPLGLFSPASVDKGKGEEGNSNLVQVSCPICDEKEASDAPQSKEEKGEDKDKEDKDEGRGKDKEDKEEDREEDKDKDKDDNPSLPHLISKYDVQVFDCLFRTPYAIRADGWVCDGERRLFWLPQHLRPLRNDPQCSMWDNKMVILTHNRRVVFLTLCEDP